MSTPRWPTALRKTIKALETAGYVCEKTGSGHVRVRMSAVRRTALEQQGFDVDSAPAQVILACSSSDSRSVRNAKALLRRIGYVS